MGRSRRSKRINLPRTDSALSSLTDILQKASTLAVQGASDTQNSSDRADIATQINQLLNEAISIGNTQYNGKYLFAGTAVTPTGPVTAVGNPPSAVTINGNNETVTQQFPGGQNLALSTSLQAAFNTNSADGSSDVFTTLINLRNALQGTAVNIQSQSGINATGQIILPATTLAAGSFGTALTADSSGDYSLSINGPAGQQTLTFTGADSLNTIVAAINGSATGVSASFDETTQKIALTSTGNFTINDAASAGATNTGNLLEVLALPSTGSTALNVSGEIGEVQNVLNVALTSRAQIGSNIQVLSSVTAQTAAQSTNDTAAQSAIEDANIPQATSQFSLAQTALQAAYLTTSKLEGNLLFNYLPQG